MQTLIRIRGFKRPGKVKRETLKIMITTLLRLKLILKDADNVTYS